MLYAKKGEGSASFSSTAEYKKIEVNDRAIRKIFLIKNSQGP